MKTFPDEWQPIETAPRDGTHILASDRTPGATGFGKYNGITAPFCAVVHWWHLTEEQGFYLSSGDQGNGPLMSLTHWKPL